MNNCCQSNFYRTPFNINYQNLYCPMAQSAPTDLNKVVTSGWSYNRMKKMPITENYCNCVSRVVNTPMNLQYRQM